MAEKANTFIDERKGERRHMEGGKEEKQLERETSFMTTWKKSTTWFLQERRSLQYI